MLSVPALKRRFVSQLLLVVYGTVGALGYGLHILGHQHGLLHEHSGNCSHSPVESYNPGHSFVQDEFRYEQSFAASSDQASSTSANQTFASSEQSQSVSDEDCPICLFLTQSQSPAHAFFFANHSVATPATRSVDKQLESLLVKRDYPPRGPPLCG